VLTERWNKAESYERLAETLRASVQIHADSNALPRRAAMPLQTALAEWNLPAARALLTAKARDLEALRFRLELSLVRLADEYRMVLLSHLDALDRPRSDDHWRAAPASSVRSLNRETARKLDALDARRRELETELREAATVADPASATVGGGQGRVP
jgi:hypothetical protein